MKLNTTKILKLDNALQLLVGVAMVAGEVDAQGDVIDDYELTKAAMNAMGAGVKIDHQGGAVGRVVQSLALTADLAAALGLPEPEQAVWIVGLKVDDPATWARVRAGELNGGLSIGGRANTEQI